MNVIILLKKLKDSTNACYYLASSVAYAYRQIDGVSEILGKNPLCSSKSSVLPWLLWFLIAALLSNKLPLVCLPYYQCILLWILCLAL